MPMPFGLMGKGFGKLGSALGKGVGYDATAKALFAAVPTPFSTPQRAKINTLISALKAAGVWQKLDRFYGPGACETADQYPFDWVTATSTITKTGTVTFAALGGVTGDGTAGLLDTGFNPTTATTPKFTLNSASMFHWSRTNLANAGTASGDIGSSSSGIRRSGAVSGRALAYPNYSTAGLMVNDAAYPGFSGWVRTGNAAWKSYSQGAMVASGADVATALSNRNFYLCAVNAAAIVYGVNQEAFAGWGSQLADAEVAALYTALANYFL